jgi:hypothetical protein
MAKKKRLTQLKDNRAEDKVRKEALEVLAQQRIDEEKQKRDPLSQATGVGYEGPYIHQRGKYSPDPEPVVPTDNPDLAGPGMSEAQTQPVNVPQVQTQLNANQPPLQEVATGLGEDPGDFSDMAGMNEISRREARQIARDQRSLDRGARSEERREKLRNLDWGKILAYTGMGLSGLGASINPQGNVSQAMAPHVNRVSNWDNIEQDRMMLEMGNDPKSNLSLMMSDALGMKGKGYTFNEMNRVAGHIGDKIKRDFAIQQANKPKSSAIYEKLKQERFDMDLETYNIPGYELQKGFRPKNPDKLKQDVATLNTLDDQFEQLMELVKEHGSYEAFGEGHAKMKNLAVNLQLLHKDVFGLGAITGPDMAIINRIADDPSDWKSLFTRDKTMLTQLAQGKRSLDKRMDDKLQAFGYKRKGDSSNKKGSDYEKAKEYGKEFTHPDLGRGYLFKNFFITEDGKKHEVE